MLVVLVVRFSGEAEADAAPGRPLPRAWWLAALPAVVFGGAVLLDWIALGVVDGDSATNTRPDGMSWVAYLVADAGMPSRVHAVVRLVTGTADAVPGAWSLNLGFYGAYCLAVAALAARFVPLPTAALITAFVALDDELLPRFHQARAYPIFLTTVTAALAVGAIGRVSARERGLAVGFLALAVLDNPLCGLALLGLAAAEGLNRRVAARWAAIGLGLGLMMAPAMIQAVARHGALDDRGLWAEVYKALLPAALLIVPARRGHLEVARWAAAIAVIATLAGMWLGVLPLGERVVLFVRAWVVVIGIALIADWVGGIVPTIGLAIWTWSMVSDNLEGRYFVFDDRIEEARALHEAWTAMAGAGDELVVLPGHMFPEYVTAARAVDPWTIGMPIDSRPPLYMGLGEAGGVGMCERGAPQSWAVVYVSEVDSLAGMFAACGACETVDDGGWVQLIRCEGAP